MALMDVFTHFSIVRRERRGIRPEEIKPTFRPLVVETNSCSSPCVVRLLAITKNYEVSHSIIWYQSYQIFSANCASAGQTN
jgi:hypothetical protein